MKTSSRCSPARLGEVWSHLPSTGAGEAVFFRDEATFSIVGTIVFGMNSSGRGIAA
jgi:hypothetical protein